MPTAFTPLTAGTIFSSIGAGSYIEQCRTGAEQRLRALCGDTYSCQPMPAAGDPILSATFWGASGGGGTSYAIQEVIAGLVTGPSLSIYAGPATVLQYYVDHRGPLTIEGQTTIGGFPKWTFPNLRVAAGLPTTRYWDNGANFDTMTEHTDQTNTLFVRKARRRISNLTATRDEQGNPAAAGQIAYGIGPPAALCVSENIYRCVASGNWVRDESIGVPDLLSNVNGLPNTVAESLNGAGFPGESWGNVRAGDCFGEWIINEIMACLDLMRWVLLPILGNTRDARGMMNYIDWTAGLDDTVNQIIEPTYAAAVAATTAAWGTATASPSPTISATGGINDFQGGFRYGAYALKSSADYQPAFPISALAKKWAYFIWVDKSGNDTFDAEGDAVLDSQYHNFANGLGVATAPPTGLFGDVTRMPNIPPDPGPDPFFGDTSATSGYAIADMVMLCKFNVAGGFDRCSATD